MIMIMFVRVRYRMASRKPTTLPLHLDRVVTLGVVEYPLVLAKMVEAGEQPE